MEPELTRTILIAQLYRVLELESKAHQAWDHAWTNKVIAEHPDTDRFTQETYAATRLHAEAVNVLDDLIRRLNEI